MTAESPVKQARRNPEVVRELIQSLRRKAYRGTPGYLKTPRERRGGNVVPPVERTALQTTATTGNMPRQRITDNSSKARRKSQDYGAVVTQHHVVLTPYKIHFFREHYESKTAWYTPFNNNPFQGSQYAWEKLMRACL